MSQARSDQISSPALRHELQAETKARTSLQPWQEMGRKALAATTGRLRMPQLFNPISVAVDSSGNLYIADSDNGRIRKVAGRVPSPPWRAAERPSGTTARPLKPLEAVLDEEYLV